MKAKTIALTISLVFVSMALGFQDNPQLGAWKLNEAKSKFAGKARNHTVVYETAGDEIKDIAYAHLCRQTQATSLTCIVESE